MNKLWVQFKECNTTASVLYPTSKAVRYELQATTYTKSVEEEKMRVQSEISKEATDEVFQGGK